MLGGVQKKDRLLKLLTAQEQFEIILERRLCVQLSFQEYVLSLVRI